MKMAESSLMGYKTLGKGYIACYKQFLFFPTMPSNDFYCRHVKKIRACLGKDLKSELFGNNSDTVYCEGYIV